MTDPQQQYLPCYHPLDRKTKAIRLLILLPDLHPIDNRMQTALCHYPLGLLGSVRPYIALSYTWGDPHPSDQPLLRIWVNDTLVPVRRNLLCALRALRMRDGDQIQVLWIDALCINQDDLDERGQQVGFMGEIYRNAELVLIWLGADTFQEQQHETLDVTSFTPTEIIHPAFELPSMFHTSNSSSGCTMTEWLSSHTEEDYQRTDQLWRAFFELIHNPYWKRLWIIQEVWLAKKKILHIGSSSLAWDTLSNFIKCLLLSDSNDITPGSFLRENIGRLAGLPRPVIVSLMYKLQRKSLTTLEDLMALSEHSLCQDPRDKIYGLLGLATDVIEGQIRIDYSFSLYDLYESVILSYMEGFANGSRSINKMRKISQLLQSALLSPEANRPCLESAAPTIPLCNNMEIYRSIKDSHFSMPVRTVDSIFPESCIETEREELNEFLSRPKEARKGESTPSMTLGLVPRRTSKYSSSWDRFLSLLVYNNNRELNPFMLGGEAVTVNSLELFITTGRHIGIATKAIKRGDRLCHLKFHEWQGTSSLFAIVRLVPSLEPRSADSQRSEWQFVSRAIVCNVNHGLLPVSEPGGQLQWPLPSFFAPTGRWHEGKLHFVRANVEILQLLTCPVVLE